MHRVFILNPKYKSKDYFKSIAKAVKINKTAKIYSIIFFIFISLINILKLFPNIAHKHIDGKQTRAAVIVRKAVAM